MLQEGSMCYIFIIRSIILTLIISLSANIAFAAETAIICSAPDRRPLERTMGANAKIMFEKLTINDEGMLNTYRYNVNQTKKNHWLEALPGFGQLRFQYLPDQKKMKLLVIIGHSRHGPAYYNQCIEQNKPSKTVAKKHVENGPNILRAAFKDLSEYQRKNAQKILTMYGFYNSKIDGLYGKGTEKALKGYNKKFLNNSDLSKDPNIAKLLNTIFEDKVIEAQEDLNKKSKITSNQKRSEVDITVQDLKTAFSEKKFELAMEMASTLSQRGEAEAFYYLGKMFAEGSGTLQLSKNAHMWFNIAAMNGISGAADARKKIADDLTSKAVDEAQMLAIKCIESKYTDCGFMPFD